MYKTLSLGVIALICTPLVAQSTIPAGYSKIEGFTSRHVPLAYNSARIQLGYDARATGWKAPRFIKELWVRADSTGYLKTGFSVEMQVLLSSKGCSPATPSMRFVNNHGTDGKIFLKKRTFKFAPMAKVKSPPADWTIQLKGDSPFLASTGNLVIDWSTYSKSNQFNPNLFLDAARIKGTATGTPGTSINYGTPCNPNNFFNYSTGLDVDNVLRQYCYTRHKYDIVFTWAGATRIKASFPGLKGCSLYTVPLIFHPYIAFTKESTGYANFEWGRVISRLRGKKVWLQCGAVDLAFQAMRLSRGNEVQFGDRRVNYPRLISHKYGYATGSTPFDPDTDEAQFGWVDTAIIFDVR